MNDTITRLMGLADDYALRCYHHDDPASIAAIKTAMAAIGKAEGGEG